MFAMQDARCRPGNEALKIVKLVILITDTLSLNVVNFVAGDLGGPAETAQRRRPLRRRCAFGGAITDQTTPSCRGRGRCGVFHFTIGLICFVAQGDVSTAAIGVRHVGS
jgi:hypothetical protein